MLGTISRDHVLQLAERLATADAAQLLRYAQSLEEWAPDYAQVLDELASLLARIALKHVVKDFDGDDLYPPELLERLAGAIPAEDVQLYYQTAIVGRRDLALAPDPRTGFEMALLRMVAFRPQAGGEAVPAAVPGGRPAGSGSRVATPSAVAASVAPSSGLRVATAPATAVSGAPPAAAGAQDWAAIVSGLELQGAARQLAAHCVLVDREGAVVRLELDPRSKFMRTTAVEDKLAQALSKHFGELVRVEFTAVIPQAETPAQADQRLSQEESESARRAFDSDPGVQGFRDRFGATPLADTIRPAK
jgi:DNA polymerase-3 subunit gamma/tau